jgi:predicted  nucleic acid-binding Zn-ribbon protein
MYRSLRDTREDTRKAQEARATLEKTAQQLDAEVQQASKARSDLKATLKGTKNQLDQTQASKRVMEQRLQQLTNQVTQAVEAREAAERALAEARKILISERACVPRRLQSGCCYLMIFTFLLQIYPGGRSKHSVDEQFREYETHGTQWRLR